EHSLSISATDPYSDFNDSLLLDLADEGTPTISIKNLYIDEFDQGAFILSSQLDDPIDFRIEWDTPKDLEGDPFEGKIMARRVVATGAVNGELAYDALPPLGPGNIVTVPARRAVKIWLNVDAHGGSPGKYRSTVRAFPVLGNLDPISASLEIEVVDLKMPKEFPLSLCVWDYVPNRWFPSNTDAVMKDMRDHGVNVFPRPGCEPKGEVDQQGRLQMDWSPLETELKRIGEGSVLLFHFHEPPIKHPETIDPEVKTRYQEQYLTALRDYLADRGRSYDSYAFYPIDEPGYAYGGRIPVLRETATMLHQVDPKFRVYTNPVMALAWKDFQSVAPDIGVWAPNMRLVTGAIVGDPRMSSILSTGDPVWSYECLAQVRSLSPLRYNRAYPWRAKFFGLSGIGLWTHCTTNTDPWLKGEGINDEFTLVYPGETTIPSVRWEALRDGMEDIAALEILADRVHKAEGLSGLDEPIARAKATIRRGLSEVSELSDEAFIESRDYLRQGRRRIWHAPTDVDLYHRLREEIVQRTLKLPVERP
ncbi:MAG: DUF4091 domain-containing protein, partial [Candidatus Omnitrophica bacterium]|nr:DUF4091 domain-containing protein [Candidatus Omnitrophota bacterium]